MSKEECTMSTIKLQSEVREKILQKHGQFTSLIYERALKTKKSCTNTYTKHTEAKNVRIGASYDNLRSTIIGRMSGTLPEVNAGLNGLEWVSYPNILVNPKTGREFVRVELTSNSKFNNIYRDEVGSEVNKADIADHLLASEKRKGDMPTVINIPLDTIVDVH